MKNIGIFSILIFVAFLSCDGRQSKRESLQKSVNEFNQKNSKVENISFHPKEYTEVVTDTIISNNLKVHIKNYSLQDDYVKLNISEEKTTYHRAFATEIKVSTATKEVYSTRISADDFKLNDDEFWDNATLEHAWVNLELSSAEEAQIDISFLNPLTKAYKLYRLVVTSEGSKNIYIIEDYS